MACGCGLPDSPEVLPEGWRLHPAAGHPPTAQACHYSVPWRLIKARFSREMPVGPLRASYQARQEREIWQRRFGERHIRGEADLAAHIRYSWWNPVKHGFVKRHEDWVYSPVHRDIRDSPHKWRFTGRHYGLPVGCVISRTMVGGTIAKGSLARVWHESGLEALRMWQGWLVREITHPTAR
jgi:hypothetical protein